MPATPRRPHPIRRLVPAAGALLGLALLLRGIDLHRTATALSGADPRWIAGGVVLSAISLAGGACVWIALVRDRAPEISARTLLAWHLRSLLAGQVVPTGAGGDCVRGVAVARLAGAGTALGSLAMGRVTAALAMAVWGVAGAVILRDAVGAGVVITACAGLGAMLAALALALGADGVVGRLARSRRRTPARIHAAVAPLAETLASWRRAPGLVLLVVLMATAGWGINLAALTLFGHAVGVDAGWQVFAVTIPVTLAATWLPVAANGIGVREGILVGLLVHAGAGSGQAAALSILVDLQMLPFALLGALLWLRTPEAAAGTARPHDRPAPGDEALVAVPTGA